MKNLLLIAIASFTLFNCKAQTIYNISTTPENRSVRDNYYMKDLNNYNDAFVGVWKWEDGLDSFEITLQEFEMYSYPISPNIYRDAIYGKYIYKENNIIISEVQTIETFANLKLSLSYSSPTIYGVVIQDVISNISLSGTFTLQTPNTAKLILRPRKGLLINDQSSGEFRLPNNIVFTKQ